MMKTFKYLQLLTLGVYLLMSTDVFAAKNACYSEAELNDFKTLYIKLQNQLNYEKKDAYLDKNMQVQLRPHAINTPYPGKEFEAALFGEYQNSLRKIGKLYQDAKYEGNDDFKSNEVLINFMKAIDDKSSDSKEYIENVKIKDVINALEAASKKKYGNSANKKFVLNSGDKYLLEKLLTHSQDRICSVMKYDQTKKDTALFKAEYLQKVKNAPLNRLINTIKNGNIEQGTKIDLKPTSNLTSDLVDTDITIKSAIAENIGQLSDWVKKIKAKGAACMAMIKTKSFANKIQAEIQGCNFGHFMETLSQDNVNNLESVLHFINANERLLDRAITKAETNLDEIKLEGFINNAFGGLGKETKCTIIESTNGEERKIFVQNLPYDEKSNKFDTSAFSCKTTSKTLDADNCAKQFDFISDSLGRGIELKPKNNIDPSLVLSINDAKSCSNVLLNNSKSQDLTTNKDDKCNGDNNCLKLTSDEAKLKCESQKKTGYIFTWDASNKSCNESLLLTKHNNKELCEAQKKTGIIYSWDSSKKMCNELPFIPNFKSQKEACEARKKADTIFTWDANKKTCNESPLKTNLDKSSCESQIKEGSTFSWDAEKKVCNELPFVTDNEKELCEAKKKDNTIYTWDAENKSCNEKPSIIKLQSDQLACEARKKTGVVFTWDTVKKICNELPLKIDTKEACEAQVKDGIIFTWDTDKKICNEQALIIDNEKIACEAKTNAEIVFTWDSEKKVCNEQPFIINNDKVACEAKKKTGFVFTWDTEKKICNEIPSLTDKNDSDKGRLECEQKNADWIKKENEGRPSEKYIWDGKVCKDLKPAAKEAKKENSENIVEQEAPSAPKKAPARFVPINIPSRQIYLMPGMP